MLNSLEFAIDMELDGSRYYREQAEINRGTSLQKVFLMLAEDEESHAEVLRKRLGHLAWALEANDTFAEVRSIFADLQNFAADGATKQLDVYQAAMEMERKSIALYEELCEKAADSADKVLFKHLIKQEQEHLALMKELVIHVRRPEQWVESAEFGRRKPY